MERGSTVDQLLSGYAEIVDRPVCLCSTDNVIWANEGLAKLVARSPSDLSDLRVKELFSTALVLSRARSMISANHLLHATGVEIQCEIRTIPLADEIWAVEITVKSFYDHESELAVYKQRLWTLADQVPVGIFISEVGLRVQYVNDKLVEIFESTAESLTGMGWARYFPPDERETIVSVAMEVLKGTRGETTVNIVTPSNRTKRIHVKFADVKSLDGASGFVGTVEDVTDRVAYEQSLTYAATHDNLTQLPNRAALEVDLHGIVRDVQSGRLEGVMLAFCDLDEFKSINDTFGHLVGDQLLVEMASRLGEACGDDGRAYRYAGDEFVLIFPGVVSEYEAMDILARLEYMMAPKINLDGIDFVVSGSFGYSIGMGANVSMRTLLDSADEAMYSKKASKKLLSMDLFDSSPRHNLDETD